MSRIKTLLLAFIFLGHAAVHAQMSWTAFAEDYIYNNEEEDADRAELIYEQLNELHTNPIDLNTATADALLQIPFIDEEQAKDILSYRDKHFPIRSTGELMFVRSLSREDREILQLFCYAGSTDNTHTANLKHLISHSRHEVLLRFDIPFYTTVGQMNGIYRGNSTAQKFRYAMLGKSHLYAGVQTDKDSGERGIDFVSAYAMIKDIKTGRRSQIRELIVGNYRASFGLGLAINTAISYGKNLQGTSIGNIDKGFSRHASFLESNYLTGAALRYQYGNVTLSAYGAYNRPDGNYNSDSTGITSLKTDGLHRTELEYSKRHNLGETNFGGNVHVDIGDLQLSATATATHFSMPLAPRWNTPASLYRKYNAAGTDFQNYSIAYSYNFGKIKLAGETAISLASKPQTGLATLNMLQYKPNTDNTLKLLFRHYWAQYTTIHGNAFSENSRPQNEQGLFLSWNSSLKCGLDIYTYVDLMRFPWLKSGVNSSSYGIDYMAQATYNSYDKRHRWLLSYRLKSKQKNFTYGGNTLVPYNTRQTLRLQHTFNANQCIALTTTVNGVLINFAINPAEKGYSFSETMRWMILPNILRLSSSLTYVNTDSYNARVYSYEPTLLYTFGMQSYYYHALRGMLMTDFTPIPHLTFTAKISLIKYFDRNTISSGNNQIYSSMKSDLQLQLRYTF